MIGQSVRALIGLGGVLAILAMSTNARPARAQAPAESDWCPELGEALRLYRAGDHLAAAQASRDRMATGRSAQVRREAAALYAMTLMRSAGREDRQEGRARLDQLAREDRSLALRPECQLALGLASAALSETARALGCLQDAADAFAARRDTDGEAEACLALAETWLRHGEWEITPPRFHVICPRTSEQARQVRREQVARVRARLAAIPHSAEALARLDLLCAEDLLTEDHEAPEGLRILAELASARPLNAAGARAAQNLAQRYERSERVSDAVALYRRLMSEGPREIAAEAGQRLGELTHPQIHLDVTTELPVGQPVLIHLRVRNLEEVQVEARRVELGTWLASRQGRLAEASLPEAGSLQLSRRLETRAEHDLAEWESGGLAEPVSFAPAAGAYVIVVSPIPNRADVPAVKRLVLASDLRAAVLAGPERALLWVVPARGASSEKKTTDETVRARFWMHGSFVPTEVRVESGIAEFSLPAESRVLRDKRWVCLVEAGEEVALCQGSLEQKEASRPLPAIALAGGPGEPRVGEPLAVAGLVLGPWRRGGPGEDSPPWWLEVRDALDQSVYGTPLELSPAGTFSTQIPIAADMENRHLRLLVRWGDRSVENVRGRLAVRVAPVDTPELVIRCGLPPRQSPSAPLVPVQVQAWYPWGTALRDAEVDCLVRVVRLPAADSAGAFGTGPPMVQRGKLDERGLSQFLIPTASWGFSGSAQALGVWARVTGWEGLQGQAAAETLVSEQPVHAWLTHTPSDPQLGDEVSFHLGWFDPAGESGIERPTIEIVRGSECVARLATHPGVEGLRSEPWRPAAAGTYQAIAVVPRLSVGDTRVARTVSVRSGELAEHPRGSTLRCAARRGSRGGQPGIQVRLEGQVSYPLLVVAAGENPLAAGVLPGVSGTRELFLAAADTPAPTRVLVAASGAAGLEMLADEAVAAEAGRDLALTVRLPPGVLQPGSTATVRVGSEGAVPLPGEVMLLARLIDAVDTGVVRWLPGEQRVPEAPVRGTLTVASSVGLPRVPAGEPAAAGARQTLPSDLVEWLCEGATLWAGAQPVRAGGTDWQVPIPALPGLYRLLILAVAGDGRMTRQETLLDARAGLRVTADVPTRLTQGDRTVAGVFLESMGSGPADTRVIIRSDENLAIESLRMGNRTLSSDPSRLDGGVTLDVAPGQPVWLQLAVEAAQTGRGALQVDVETGGRRQTTRATCEVAAEAPAPDSPPTIHVRRTLLRLTQERVPVNPGTDEPAEDGFAKTVWQRWPLAPDQRLSPGEHLLVHEEISLDLSLADVSWFQRLPPNGHAIQTESQAHRTIGTLKGRRLDGLRFEAGTLAAGSHQHEYHAVAVRPGTCALPPPKVEAAGRPVTVVVEPDDLRIQVTGPP